MRRIDDLSSFHAAREAGLAKLLPPVPRIAVGMGTCGTRQWRRGVSITPFLIRFRAAAGLPAGPRRLLRGLLGRAAGECPPARQAAGDAAPRSGQRRHGASSTTWPRHAYPPNWPCARSRTGTTSPRTSTTAATTATSRCGTRCPSSMARRSWSCATAASSVPRTSRSTSPSAVTRGSIRSSSTAIRKRSMTRSSWPSCAAAAAPVTRPGQMGNAAQGAHGAEVPHLQRRRRRPRRLHEPQRNRKRPPR